MPLRVLDSRPDQRYTMRWLAAVLIALGFAAGCASTNDSAEWGPLKASVEALYLNYQDLRILHSDLHAAALTHIEAAGTQLAEIQSAARFIQQANLIAFYQWELLSITPYIRVSARRDFYILRERDLNDARDRSEDLILAIRVYEAFIRDPQARELIETCIQRIEKHIALYGQMALELRRLNGGSAFIKRPQGKALDAKIDGLVKSPISALRFIPRHGGVPLVRLIPRDSQASISNFFRNRLNHDFL